MIKLLVACSALALFTSVAQARDVAPGSVMITGDTNLEFSSSDTTLDGTTSSTDTTNINLAGVYFVAPNFGVGLFFGSEDTKTNNGVTVTSNSMNMIGPILGYNINLGGETSFMVHAGYFVANGDTNDGAGFSADIDGSGYMLGGTINYFLNESVALNFGLRHTKADIDFSYSGITRSADLKETATTIGLATFF